MLLKNDSTSSARYSSVEYFLKLLNLLTFKSFEACQRLFGDTFTTAAAAAAGAGAVDVVRGV